MGTRNSGQEHIAALFSRMPDEDARLELFDEFLPLALSLSSRYRHRGTESDDLRQVASIGLLNAIDRFDPEFGARFVSFAIPTITGELKKYFRDAGWAMAVPRRLKELSLQTRKANAELSQRLGRSATIEEIAAEIGASEHDVEEAAAIGFAYRPESLEASAEWLVDRHIADSDGGRALDDVDDVESLRPLLAQCSDRERLVIHLRFVEERTQSEIADRIGVSQMQVSRIISTIVARLGALSTR